MNQITLSNDLNVITAEINSFKQVAGQSIFEIGKRLKYVKENDLTHGQWLEWLDSIDFDIYQASRFIKVFEELNDSKLRSGANIGFKALYEIATMSEEHRDQQHTVPSTGETKAVEDMTIKELREVKKALSESEKAKEAAEKTARKAEAKHALAVKHNTEQSEKYQAQIDDLKKSKTADSPATLKKITDLEAAVHQRSERIKVLETAMQATDSGFDEEAARKQRAKMQHEADVKTIDLRVAFKRFIEGAAISSVLYGAIATASPSEKKHLCELVEMAEKVIHDTKIALTGRRELDL